MTYPISCAHDDDVPAAHPQAGDYFEKNELHVELLVEKRWAEDTGVDAGDGMCWVEGMLVSRHDDNTVTANFLYSDGGVGTRRVGADHLRRWTGSFSVKIPRLIGVKWGKYVDSWTGTSATPEYEQLGEELDRQTLLHAQQPGVTEAERAAKAADEQREEAALVNALKGSQEKVLELLETVKSDPNSSPFLIQFLEDVAKS